MDILYNGVWLTMCSLDEYSEQQVYDPSGVDYLFTRHRIVGKFIVNGQAEVREVAGPPVSYTKTEDLDTAANIQRGTLPDGLLSDPNLSQLADPAAPSVNLASHPSGAIHSFSAAPGTPAPGVTTRPVGDLLPGGGIYARRKDALTYYTLVAEAGPVPLTHRAISHRLAVPRQSLFVFAATGSQDRGELLLRSPSQFHYQTDANNGPKPLFCEILYSMGEADTHLVAFGIETYVNESAEAGTREDSTSKVISPLLSNRFSMTHSVNEDQVTQISVQGEAYFRTDYMYDEGISPDAYRVNLFLPIPFGFVREEIQVQGMEGANGVRYSFTDRQLPVFIPGAVVQGATRIKALHTQTVFTDTDLLHAGSQFADSVTQRALNNKWLRDADSRDRNGSGGGSADAAKKAALEAIAELIQTLSSSVKAASPAAPPPAPVRVVPPKGLGAASPGVTFSTAPNPSTVPL